MTDNENTAFAVTVDYSGDVETILTSERTSALEELGVHVPSLGEVIAEQRARGVSIEEIGEKIDGDIATMTSRQAEARAQFEQAEAKQEAERVRQERLATATIILPAIFEDAPDAADRAEIVAVAVDFADRLIAATKEPVAKAASAN